MLCWGFDITTGIADYPTILNIEQTNFNEKSGNFHIQGKIRDNDDPNYFLSLEIIDGEDRINCGYNKTGDNVELILKKFLKKENNILYYKGEVQVSRNGQKYFLSQTDTEGDAQIMKKANWGDEFVFVFSI